MKLLLAIALVGSCANATIKPYVGRKTTDNPDYAELYLVNGSKASNAQAFTAALEGKEVYKCVIQEVSMGKSGMSAGMRNTKKRQ